MRRPTPLDLKARWFVRAIERHFPGANDPRCGTYRTLATIADRYHAGDTIADLARDYQRPRSAIHAAIAWEHIRRGIGYPVGPGKP